MTLSPSEVEDVKRLAASEIAAQVIAVDLDALNMLDLSTAASFLGIPLERAARVLPVVELGPRTRRVRISDYKAYVAKHTRQPAVR
jgi:hypothetical protein